VMAALKTPSAQPRAALSSHWHVIANALLVQADFRSNALSSAFSGVDSFVEQVIRTGNIAWDTRTQAGADRRFVSNAIAGGYPMAADTRQQLAVSLGSVTNPWAIVRNPLQAGTYPP